MTQILGAPQLCFLLSSPDPSLKASQAHSYHLSALEDPSIFKMVCFSSTSAGTSKQVCGGDIVRIFHRHTERFVTSDGCERVHLIGDKIEELPIFTLWRLEQEASSSGSVAEYNGTCRFRHITSGKYLCLVNTTQGVILETETTPGPGTVFTLTPVFATFGAIHWHSVVHMRHVETGRYVHATAGMTKHIQGGTTSRDGATSDMMGTHILHKEDGFAIMPVDAALLRDLQIVSGCAQSLSSYLELIESEDEMAVHRTRYTNVYIHDLLATVKDLCAPIPHTKEATHDRLRRRSLRHALVRQLGLLGSVVALCKAAHANQRSKVMSPALGDRASVEQLVESCHDAIKAAISGSAENSLILLGEFDELQRQVAFEPGGAGAGGAAARTLLELVQGSFEVAQSVTEAQIEFFLEGMESDTNKRLIYAQFVSYFCCCKGRGIRESQDAVVRGLLRDRERAKMLPSLRSSDKKGAINVVLSAAMQAELQLNARQFSLEVLCRSAPGSAERRVLYVLQACLELFESVCAGCHWEARALIQAYAPYQPLLSALAEESLSAELRCHVTNLMTRLYVERGPADYLSPQSATQLLNEVDSNKAVSLPEPLFQADKELGGFKLLKKAAITGMAHRQERSNAEDRVHDDRLVLAMSRLASHLVRLGFFSSEDEIKAGLVPHIMTVLSNSVAPAGLPKADPDVAGGGKGVPPVDIKYIRSGPGQCARMDAKRVCCKMLLFVLELRASVRVPLLLSIYKSSIAATGPVNKRLAGSDEVARIADKMKQNGRDDIVKVLQYLTLPDPKRLSKVLVDLLRYRDPRLVTVAMTVLFREQSPGLELYKLILNVQILKEPSAILAYRQAIKHLAVMRRHIPAFLEAAGALARGEQLPVMRGLGDAQRRELGEAVEECARLCQGQAAVLDDKASKPPGGPEAKGKQMTQEAREGGEVRETLGRAGVHLAVLQIIRGCLAPPVVVNSLRSISSNASGGPSGGRCGGGEGSARHAEAGAFALAGAGQAEAIRKEVLSPCMRFVENFCAGCGPAQAQLFAHVHDLVACMQQGVGATRAASAVLHGNDELSLRVPERLIHSVAAAIARRAEEGLQRAHHLRFLHGLCKGREGRVIKKNAMLILKFLSDFGPIRLAPPPGAASGGLRRHQGKAGHTGQREAILVLFRGDEGRRQRLELVRRGETCASGGLLEYHLELLSLLQTILLDYSPEAYSRVQVIFPHPYPYFCSNT